MPRGIKGLQKGHTLNVCVKNPISGKHSSKSTRVKRSESMVRYYQEHPEAIEEQRERSRGRHQTEKTKEKLRKINTGKHPTEATKEKIRNTLTGKFCGEKSPCFGKHLSKEHIEKIKKSLTGKQMPQGVKDKIRKTLSGKRRPKEVLEKIRGKNHYNYKGGITPLGVSIRNLPEGRQWRNKIFQRDNFTCQDCGARSGNGKAVILHPHHTPKAFADILSEFLEEYNQFSPYDDKDTLVRLAIKYQPFWDIDDGTTLCKRCHKKFHKRRKKLNEKEKE